MNIQHLKRRARVALKIILIWACATFLALAAARAQEIVEAENEKTANAQKDEAPPKAAGGKKLTQKFGARVAEEFGVLTIQRGTKPATTFSGAFDARLLYSLHYGPLYFSVIPKFFITPERRVGFIMQEVLVSYGGAHAELSIGKGKETRYLSINKDYLTVNNREIGFLDEFSFWRASALFPMSFVSVEAGVKYIRQDYLLEWDKWNEGISKAYVYSDFYAGDFSAHAGAAVTYDVRNDALGGDYTARLAYDILGYATVYFANLFSTDYNIVTLDDYSFAVGVQYTPISNVQWNVTLSNELWYEAQKITIAPGVLVEFRGLQVSNVFSYNVQSNTIKNNSYIKYKFNALSVEAFNTFSKTLPEDSFANAFGIRVSYEI